MNRTGLVIALLVGVVVGIVFAVYPQLDIAISRLFFNETYRVFPVQYSLVARHLRDIFTYIVAVLVAPAFIAIALKFLLPRRQMLIATRAAVFLIATLALAPGLMANVILKDFWGRPRPAEIQEFYGTEKFVPWWDPRGTCDKNCSFVAGDCLRRRAPVRLGCGTVAAFGRRAFFHRCGVLRRIHVSHRLDGARPDLPLAHAPHRRAGRTYDRAHRAAGPRGD